VDGGGRRAEVGRRRTETRGQRVRGSDGGKVGRDDLDDSDDSDGWRDAGITGQGGLRDQE